MDREAVDALPLVLRQSIRFEVRHLLGRGAFGEVYLARDHHLSRLVAIKVPRADKLTAPDDLNRFLGEARAAAALHHPGIVTVFDVQNDQHGVFIVLEFVEGCTLGEHAASKKLSLTEIVRLMVDITQAVAYAHEHGLVHRDLKPSNILVDAKQRIRITDFGLAIHEDGQRFLASELAGTPMYMAPEQVRCETHRLDGRTDIWGLGVIFYELITGRRAFDGATQADIYDEVLHSEPRPPRQIVPEIPRELERICLKSLSRRMSDRYPTGRDLAEDLMHWLALAERPRGESAAEASTEVSSQRLDMPVIPKGLRSFDQHDADFYLSLLPGPYDRQGQPESVRFWKQRIDERDPSATFSVGLMFGPSGCGKTSLLRAGILPRLAQYVRWVYVEAAADGVEKRIQRAISRVFPELPLGVSLVETLVELRVGHFLKSDEKLFIVLDQCEQWLTGREISDREELVQALRHCDGGRLQCLVMVRDDFSMAATRFMNALEIPIVEGQNCAAIDVFHREHARKVLRRFGEAFDRLPLEETTESNQFVTQAVELLSEGNVVTPVRLAAFAELTRHQPWTATTLRSLGGSQGLGAALLEACLGESTTNPVHRQHRQAARLVLEELLPENPTSLKGRMRSQTELMVAAGYANRPQDFETLLNMLDKQLRLVSPADPQQGLGAESDSTAEGSSRSERYFQLSHDYLVPSLNAWLTEKQRATRAGRASLLLETISSEWNARPDVRRLPTLMEWLSLRWWTRASHWNATQRRMMIAADRRYVTRLLALTLMIAVSAGAMLYVHRRGQFQWREQQARAAAMQLLVADISRVDDILRSLDALDSSAAKEILNSVSASPERTVDERLRAQLFLARDSHSAQESLLQSLSRIGPEENRVVAARLAPHAEVLSPKLWIELANTKSEERVLRLAAALAALDPQNSHWSGEATRVANALTRCENPYHLQSWVEALAPVSEHLTATLIERFRGETSAANEQTAAATALIRYLQGDNFEELTRLSLDSHPTSFPLFMAKLEQQPTTAIAALREQWSIGNASDGPSKDPKSVRKLAVAAIALSRLGFDAPLWSALDGSISPDIRTSAIDLATPFGVPAEVLLARLVEEGSPLGRQAALITLSERGPRLASDAKARLIENCFRLFEHDPHSGVHAAAEYALRRLGRGDELATRRSALAGQASSTRDWFVNSQAIEFTIVRGPRDVVQGSPSSEDQREDIESQKKVRLPYSFALSAHEITRDQFLRFQPEFLFASAVTPSGDCPISNVSWVDAAKFCRWLSETEGLSEDEMCYPPIDQIGPDSAIHEDWQHRVGYRLPTETEWECACRAETQTARFFGETADSLVHYSVYIANSHESLQPVGSLRPNPWGLFDIYGNVLEWCQNPTSGSGIETEAAQPDSHRALRSGTYRSVERENRSAKRYHYTPAARYAFLGIRIARSIRD